MIFILLSYFFFFRHYPVKYNGVKDFFGCLQSLREEIIKVINNHFQSAPTPIKIGVSMTCLFENATRLEEFKHVIKGKYFVILNKDESVDVVEDMLSSLNKRFENCSELKSGARLVDITKGTIEKYCFTPTHIGEFLPTPAKLSWPPFQQLFARPSAARVQCGSPPLSSTP